jgi:hypothetical protein
MATKPVDPIQAYLASIGATGFDPNGRPVGSTGGLVSLSPDQEQQLAGFRQPQQAPVQQANPMDNLNRMLGTSIGQRPQQDQAILSRQDPMTQIAVGIGEAEKQQKAAMWNQAVARAGINFDPNAPDAQRQNAMAGQIWEKINAKGANAFLPGPNAYMGGGPAPTGAEVLAAGGQEVVGYGGTLISGQAGPNGNQFMLRQGPGSGQFMPQAVQPSSAPAQAPQQAANGLQSAQEQYRQAVLATSQGDRYTRTSPMSTKDGTYLGEGVFDKQTGRSGLMGADGKFVDLPAGAEPITATGLQKSIPDQKAFRTLRSEVTDAEISLRNMDRYMNSVGGASQGVARLADKFTAGIKSLIGQGLDPQEIALKMAQGQLQGLLGANRTNVVGGGVMTEQDALRIIQRLGGDVTALSNPEIVRKAIGEVYSDRYKQYEDAFTFHNAAVSDYYGARGFKPAEKVKFSQNFTFTETPIAAPTTPTAQPQGGDVQAQAAAILANRRKPQGK